MIDQSKISRKLILGMFLVASVLLGRRDLHAQCCGDCGGDGTVTIDEIIRVVNKALTGCTEDGICESSASACNSSLADALTDLTQCRDDLMTCETRPSASAPLQTGQVRCDPGSGVTLGSCPGMPSGQDGELQTGSVREHIDNGDGTITDATTGLMWEKLGNDGSIHDYLTTYSWQASFAKVTDLNASNFAGYNDWRLPNVNELQTLVNFAAVNPAVDEAFHQDCTAGCSSMVCSCTRSNYYWTSSNDHEYSNSAWVVYFHAGYVLSFVKTSPFGVRAVRNSAAE